MNERRATDPILKDIKDSVNRIDDTIHGNGKIGLKTRVFVLWYAAIILGTLSGLILTGCAIFLG